MTATLLHMIVLIAATNFAVLATTTTEYCNMKSCKDYKKGPHIMCKYSSPTPAAACRQYATSALTRNEISEILNVHNEIRAFVASGAEERGNPGPQPAASNLEPMRWDEELAKIAQRWANQCSFKHDACRDSDRFQVGQNLAKKASSSGWNNSTFPDLVKLWFDEVDKFDGKKVKSYEFDVNTGHYTQLVWANTKLLGCGGIRYKESNGWYATYLVCDYGPSGNFQGQEMYKTL